MVHVHTLFDCKHETDVDVEIESDVEVPAQVRGLGKCPACYGEDNLVPIAGVAPQPGGQRLTLDSILLMPL